MKKLIDITKYLGVAAIAIAITIGSFAHAANYPITGQNYYLAGAGVTSSQATVPLTSFKTPDGRAITMSMIGDKGYGTLEPQSPAKTELITFTGVVQNGNGTATLTGVTRGIDFAYPYAASTTLRQAHSGGATFIITNTPNWYYDVFPIQGDNNITIWPAASSSVASRGYVDYVAFNGAGVINATTASKGVVQIGTGADAAASTLVGSTGATLAIPTSAATSTWNSSTSGNVVLVTSLAGKIDNNFIATSTLFATSSLYASPIGSIGKNTQVITTTGTSTFSVPTGVTKFTVEVQGPGAAGGSCSTAGSQFGAASGGGAGGFSSKVVDLTGTSTVQVYVGPASGTWSTFGTNGFYNSATGGSPGSYSVGNPSSGGLPGVGSGGDINISGQGGGAASSITSGASISGTGGTSHFGGGGRGVSGNTNGDSSGAYGGGGSGASCASQNQGFSGGSGSQGMVKITW